MRRRKTAFHINREDLKKKMSEFFFKGGEIEKLETPEPSEAPNDYKIINPVLCARDYPEDYFL